MAFSSPQQDVANCESEMLMNQCISYLSASMQPSTETSWLLKLGIGVESAGGGLASGMLMERALAEDMASSTVFLGILPAVCRCGLCCHCW